MIISMKKNCAYIFISVILIGYLFFQFKPSVKVPEIQQDEAMLASYALCLIENVPVPADITLGGRHILLGRYGRHGAVEDYSLLPFILVMGNTLKAVRTCTVLFGFFAILFTYLMASRLFNKTVGVISAFLLAFNRFFLFDMKRGAAFGFSIPFFALLSLLLFLEYTKTKKKYSLYLGMFMLGIGLSAVGYFIWFIFAFFLSWLIMRRFHFGMKLASVLIGFLFFLLGASTVLYYYFKTNFVRHAFFALFSHTSEGINNFLFFENMGTRLSQLKDVLKAELWGHYWPWVNWLQGLPFVLWCASLGFLLYMVLFRKKTILDRRNIIFLLLLFSFYSIIFCITFTNLWPCHLLGLLPFIYMIIAVAFYELYMRYRKRLILPFIIMPLFLVALFYAHQRFNVYHSLEREEFYSKQCSVKVLINYLLKNNITKVMFLNPREYYGAMFYSRFAFGKDLEYKYWHLTEKQIRDLLMNLPSDITFVLSEPPDPPSHTSEYFRTAIQGLHKEMSEVVIIGTDRCKYLIFKSK